MPEQIQLSEKEQQAYRLLFGLGFIKAAASILEKKSGEKQSVWSYNVFAKALSMMKGNLYGLSPKVNSLVDDQTIEDLEMLVDCDPACRHLRKGYVEPLDY